MAMFTKNKDKNDDAEDAIADLAVGEAPSDGAEETPASGEDADGAAIEDEAVSTEETAGEADSDDDDDDDEDEDSGGDGVLDLDLMDIFEAEQIESTSTAGIYSEFLEDLTMEEVLDQATVLLDEIRAKLGR